MRSACQSTISEWQRPFFLRYEPLDKCKNCKDTIIGKDAFRLQIFKIKPPL